MPKSFVFENIFKVFLFFFINFRKNHSRESENEHHFYRKSEREV